VRRPHVIKAAHRHLLRQGVKANVLFFDRRAGSERAATETLWIYDLRTNQNFTLK
jgi:type I restriction enzyme M protein